MLRIEMGRTGRYCDGLSRRSFVQLGIAGLASVGLPQILKAKEASAALGTSAKNTVGDPHLAGRGSRPHGFV